MHASRLSALCIDCNVEDLGEASRFWSQVLGREPVPPTSPGPYIPLADRPGELSIDVQKVSHSPRVHLDLETDDVEAEVKRLEALGAKRVSYVKDWWVLEAPTGQRFCVVPARRPMPANSTRWD